MNKEDSHFEDALKDFKKMKNNKQIPPLMEVKLAYLLCRITGKGQDQIDNILDLPDYQRNSLDQLNKQTGVQLFCNIVNCLSGKDVVLYFRDEKAYIRKDQTFSMWSACYITCDSNNVFIKKKPQKKPIIHFEIIDLRISKNFKPYKKKLVFGAAYRKKQNYLIGFDLEIACARTHELLRSLIKQKINRKNNRQSSTPSVTDDMSRDSMDNDMLEALQQDNNTPNKPNFNKKNRQPHSAPNKILQKQQQNKQREYIQIPINAQQMNEQQGKILQFIKQYELVGEQAYNLTKNQGNYRQFIHRKYPNKIKQILLIDSKNSRKGAFLMDLFVKMHEWNPQIEECKVVTKISDVCYLLQIKVKKYSYLAWPRGVIVVAESVLYRGNSYLYLRNIDQQPSYTDTVHMEWTQMIQVCQSLDNQKLLLTIASEFDFKGYCSVEDSQRMGLKVMNNLKLFETFVQSKQVSGKIFYLFKFQNRLSRQEQNEEKIKNGMKKYEVGSSSPTISSKTEQSQMIKGNKNKKMRRMSQQSQFSVPDEDMYERSGIDQSVDNGEKSAIITKTNIQELYPQIKDPMNFIMFMMKTDQNSEISHEIIELIRKKAHERYFLKNRFDQEPHIDPTRLQHRIEEPDHYLLQNGDWVMNKDNDAIFVNQQIINLQKDTLKFIIKQLSSNIMSGKSIMNMSLPVQIFDGRSILERVAMGFGYAPKLLVPAAETQDIIEQAKMVIAFVIGIMPLHLNMTKPFNPILGQTFQCSIGGIPVYMEQVSHHPPISAFYMKTQGFRFFGSFHSYAEMGLNQVNGRNLTPIFIEFFKTKTFYQIKTMDMEVTGMMYGDKRYRPEGKCFIHERTNNLFIEYTTGKDKKKVYPAEEKVKPNIFYGGIYTVSEKFGKKFRQCENKRKFDGLKPDDVIQTHSRIYGHWALFVDFDGKRFKTLEDPIPNKIQYPAFTLPSNSNFRLDLIYKRMGQLKKSNEEKEILQNIQRRDRKLREGKIKEK